MCAFVCVVLCLSDLMCFLLGVRCGSVSLCLCVLFRHVSFVMCGYVFCDAFAECVLVLFVCDVLCFAVFCVFVVLIVLVIGVFVCFVFV